MAEEEMINSSKDEEISEKDLELLINLIINHNLRSVQEFLKSKRLAFSGTNKIIRKRLKKGFLDKKISKDDLIKLLDELEGYGNQQIYFYKLSSDDLKDLMDDKHLLKIIEDADLLDLYNSYDPLILPETPKIISITHDKNWFKIRWGIKRTGLGKPFEEEIVHDELRGEVLIQKYLVNKIRETTLFQVSMTTGDAELFIHRSSSLDYEKEEEKYLNLINDLFGWNLKHIDLNTAINNIESTEEVRTRNVAFETPIGSNINIGSPSKDKGIEEDPQAVRTRDSITLGRGTLANFYWSKNKSDDMLTSDLYTRMYSDRISIFGERTENEVNYVIGRVRHHL